MYSRRPPDGFGLQPRPKPLKRPAQARAKFTVQAIYDAFVRIWQRDGWARLTTRAIALETGVSVGTLYEYFPNKQALLAGYVRYCKSWSPRWRSGPSRWSVWCAWCATRCPKGCRPSLAAWRNGLAAAGCQGDPARIETLFVAAWGGRRYMLLVQPPLTAEAWVAQMQHIYAASLDRPATL